MRVLKRVVVWSIELTAESLLLGCLLAAFLASQIGFLHAVVASVLVVPVVLYLHWYYLTRAFAGIALRMTQMRWLYPTTAATLFVAHMYVAFVRLTPDMSRAARGMEAPFLAGGASIVFACAFGGNWLLRKWSQSDQGEAAPRKTGDVFYPSQAAVDQRRKGGSERTQRSARKGAR